MSVVNHKVWNVFNFQRARVLWTGLNCTVLSLQSNGERASSIKRISDRVSWVKDTFRWSPEAYVMRASLLDTCQLQIASELVARKLLYAEGWCDMIPGSLDFLRWYSPCVDRRSARFGEIINLTTFTENHLFLNR